LAEDAVRIQRERLPLLESRQMLADTAVEILPEPALHRVVVRERHGRAPSAGSRPMEIMNSRPSRNRGDTVRDKRHGPTRPCRAPPRQRSGPLAVVLDPCRSLRAGEHPCGLASPPLSSRAKLRRSRSEARDPPSPIFSGVSAEERRNTIGPAVDGI